MAQRRRGGSWWKTALQALWVVALLSLLLGIVYTSQLVPHGAEGSIRSQALSAFGIPPPITVAQIHKSIQNISIAAHSPLDKSGAAVTPIPAGRGRALMTQGDPFTFPADGPLDISAANPEVEDSEDGGGCTQVHPNADSPDMLHVVYASDNTQVEGVRASVASVVATVTVPEELTVHIMVQKKWAKEFKDRFYFKPECSSTVTETGVLIRIHEIDSKLIEKSVAKVGAKIKKVRGAIDTAENFARFYMHLVLDATIVIYMDADTIVQADLRKLHQQLLESKKTIGFVDREKKVGMDQFLMKPPKGCNVHFEQKTKKLMAMTAYNVGVFAVNLQRWKEERYSDRVEELVAKHNACGGKLWKGGSQPPLLLAFFDRPEQKPADFLVFDHRWNAGELGWREKMSLKKLKDAFVLHWNGNRKPWKADGLYKELWTPHEQKFEDLLRPYESRLDAVATSPPADQASKPEKTAKKKSTTTMSPEEVAAHAACPGVNLVSEWTDQKVDKEKATQPCKIGKTYGCADGDKDAGKGMWTSNACRGIFKVNNAITVCEKPHCLPGDMGKVEPDCGIMLLTSYFTTKKDWQRNKKIRPSFSKIKVLYESAIKNKLSVTVIYDDLPEELLEGYSCDRFRFEKVNFADFDARYGVNDVRYFFFERLLKQHAEWKSAFIVDAFDVRVGMNPCKGMQKNMLYVGSELDKLKKHPWMKARFKKMGGEYDKWYKTKVTKEMKILNCGITGGNRGIMLELMGNMTQVLADPAISIMKKKEDINLNMAALNWILYTRFVGRYAIGQPVHSLYKKYQNNRNDVWFVHK